jgi:hypothetical protein
MVHMALTMTDYSPLLDELALPTTRVDGGVAWLARVAERIVAEVSVPSVVRTFVNESMVQEGGQSRRSWDVEVVVEGNSVVRIDVAVVSANHDADRALVGLDTVLAKAVECRRLVTRAAEPAQLRPWLGCIRVIEDEPRTTTSRVAEGLEATVRDRTLDAACVVAVDRSARLVLSTFEAMSFESFAASLLGHLLYINAAVPSSSDR